MCWNQVYFYCICDRVESTYRVIVHCSSLHVSYKFYLNYLWFYLWRRGKYLMVLCCSLMSYIILRCVCVYIYVLPVSLPLTDRELPDDALYSAFLIQCTIYVLYTTWQWVLYLCTCIPICYTCFFFTCDRRAITWWCTVVLYMSYSIYTVYTCIYKYYLSNVFTCIHVCVLPVFLTCDFTCDRGGSTWWCAAPRTRSTVSGSWPWSLRPLTMSRPPMFVLCCPPRNIHRG